MLQVRHLAKSFRGIKAVKGVSLDAQKGEIIGVIGPNGAGKTTFFHMLAGFVQPDSGTATYNGESIIGKTADQICHAGIGRTFQIVRPFHKLSVFDNVLVGALPKSDTMDEAIDYTNKILHDLNFDEKRDVEAQHLTLPEWKRLEVARALATKPSLLLLDEVMAGLRPPEVDGMVKFFNDLNQRTGITILMIEHVMRAVMQLSHHIVVLSNGEKIAEGEPEKVTKDNHVIECYLGSQHGHA